VGTWIGLSTDRVVGGCRSGARCCPRERYRYTGCEGEMRGRVVAAVVAGALLFGFQSLPSSAASRSAQHRFRFLAVLTTIPSLSSVTRSSGSGVRWLRP
jgi:hypothetical protein